MLRVESLPSVQKVDATEEQMANLSSWLYQEIEDALAARAPQEMLWRELMREYEAVPRNPVRNTPIENAPNMVVPIGAIGVDAIYAQVIDLVFTATPFATARATDDKWVKHAKALQLFIDWAVLNEWKIRREVEHSILDDVKIGTGVLYIPWIEESKKTQTNKVTSRGPRFYTLAPEDYLVPGGSYHDVQWTKWVAMRTWLGEHELKPKAQELGWDIDGVLPVGTVGWVRSRRETLGRTTSNRRIAILYEIWDIYCLFDIDGDGYYEDLLVIWDRTSRRILKIVYNPFDARPFEDMRYQIREHLFYGMGVMEMLRPFQEEITELHVHRVINVMLANARIWKAKTGTVPGNMRIWPNKVIELDNPDDLKPEQLGDIYSSAPQSEAITLSLAERRVGTNDMTLPRPSQVLGARTPGITALTLMQNVNRRFSAAFDSVKNCIAGAIRQALYRYSEQLKAGKKYAEDSIREVLNEEDAAAVISLLKQPDYDQSVNVFLTATSAQVNKEADRQNAILLFNILAGYYEKTLQLMMIAANPQVPQPVRDVAKKIAEKAGEVIDRTVRTFDQIRDPRTFTLEIEQELDTMSDLSQSGMLGLNQIMQTLGTEQERPGAGGLPVGGNGRA